MNTFLKSRIKISVCKANKHFLLSITVPLKGFNLYSFKYSIMTRCKRLLPMITVTTNLEGFLEHIIKSTANNILSADPETNKVADIVYISSEVNGIALRSFTAEPLRKIINTIL